jgi:uncharacterized protein YbjQ (UPF0145 family)
MTGTASFHPALSSGPVRPEQVVTSELSGEELWNLAAMGLIPQQLVMATSVYSLGVAAGIGATFRSIQRGELPEVTRLVYQARENCLELIRREAQGFGAERVIGNRLQIRELGSGLIEVMAIGTAVRRGPESMRPASPALIPQAVIVDRGGANAGSQLTGLGIARSPMGTAQQGIRQGMGGRLVGVVVVLMFLIIPCMTGLLQMFLQGR